MLTTRPPKPETTGDKVFERASIFKHPGNVVNKEGKIGEFVIDRIQERKKMYAANHRMLKSKLIR
jgi:hypothetical protein